MSFQHCGDREFLRSALGEQLPEAERTEFESHLETCELCQSTIEELAVGAIGQEELADSLRSSHAVAESALIDALPRMKDMARSSGEATSAADHPTSNSEIDFLAPSDEANSLGRLGAYEIHEVIGRGGMGVVLRGFDHKLDRVVAIKVLAPEYAANANARRRFLREAKAAAAVSHPQIVTIYAVDDSQRQPYLVMEYVDGQSLEAKIRREGQLELKEILRVGMQIASGLTAAHAQGLIHRDIKPANILLENGVERVRITDFGLARAVDDVGVTRTGEVAGTPTYMSPEQARGGRVDQRSDLFSLGSVLYAMCTGRSPFRADTTIAVIRRVCDDTPRPIREVNSDIPAWLTAIIDHLLAKRPEDRMQTAAEVADLLERHLAHLHDPDAAPPPSFAPVQRRRPLLRSWLFAACALLMVLVGLGLTEATGVTHITPYVAAMLGIRTRGGTTEPAVSTRGVAAPPAKTNDVDLLNLIDLEKHALQGDWRFEHETLVSPSTGRWDRIAIPYDPPEEYDLEVTAERKQGSDMLCITLVSGSRQFFVGLDRFEGTVSGLGLIDGKDAFANETTREQPIFKDGLPHKILCQVRTSGVKVLLDGEPLIDWQGDLDRLSIPAEGRTDRLGLCVTHSCYHIYDMILRPVNQAAHSPVAITEVRRFEGHNGPVKQVAFSPDGTHALSGSGIQGDGSVRLWELATGREIRSLEKSVGAVCCVCFSNDGRFAAGGGVRGVVYLWDVDTGLQITALQTNTNLLVVDLAFSRDDRHLLCVARKRVFDPKEKEIDGEGTARLWDTKTEETVWRFDSEGSLQAGDFLTDDRKVVVAGKRAGGTIHVLDRDSGEEIEQWESDGGEADYVEELAVSRDGRFVATAAGNGVIGLWDVKAGGTLVKSKRFKSQLHTVAFSPDGRWLWTGGGANSIWLLDVPRLRTNAAIDHPSGRVWHVAISPNGRLALSAGGNDGSAMNGDYALRLWQLPESVWPRETAVLAEPGAFVVLGGGEVEQKFDTLAEAVDASRPGDTIEIRGDGPFVTKPIEIGHALTLRAGAGARPVIDFRPVGGEPDKVSPLLRSAFPLVLEGLELKGTRLPKAQTSPDVAVVEAAGGLSAANCRFVAGRDLCCVWIGGNAAFRNCELLRPKPWRATISWKPASGAKYILENSVNVGVLNLNVQSDDELRGALVRLHRNTITAGYYAVDLSIRQVPPIREREPAVRLEAADNVFGSREAALHFTQLGLGSPPDVAESETLLRRLLDWREQRNLYAADLRLLRLSSNYTQQLETSRAWDLADWKQFWGMTETGSLQGAVRFRGGDVAAKAEADLEQLTPDDFRLRPDSAGYQAGPDGKDLGADIDLVGPGEAYERWKKEPEYQEWQRETQALMASAAAGAARARRLQQRQWCSSRVESFRALLNEHGLAKVLEDPQLNSTIPAYAVALVQLGEFDQYRQFCAELLDAYEATGSVAPAVIVNKVCLLLPGAVDVANVPIQPIDAALEVSTDLQRREHLEARALSAFRADQYEQAAGWSAEYIELPSTRDFPSLVARGLAIMAMSQYRSGAREEARKSFEKAIAAYQLRARTNVPLGLHTDILMREAAKVLGLTARPFVIPGVDDFERDFDTLAEAVDFSRPGDTIEIRGNGPFLTEPIEIQHALTIRAGEGFRPVIKNSPWAEGDNRRLLTTSFPLVVEGLELVNVRAHEPGMSLWKATLFCTGESVHLSNCRFVKRWTRPVDENASNGVVLRTTQAVVRNCDFAQRRGLSLVWEFGAGASLALENCVSSRTIAFAPKNVATGSKVRFSHTTFSDEHIVALHSKLLEGELSLDVNVENCVLDYRDNVVTRVGEAEGGHAGKMLPKLVTWRDDRAVYSPGDALVKSGPPWDSPASTLLKFDTGFTSWKRFWNEPEAQVLVGPIRFAGGDLASTKASPEQLTPQDFRLRPDSAGYQAGPDGKDLGADVDLVGPGEAYERWKQTSEYQEWQKEMQALMAEEAELAAALQHFEEQIEQRQWPEAAKTFRAELEEHGLRTVARKVPFVALLDYALVLVHLGEVDRHRQFCAELLDAFSATEDADTASYICKACLLRPGAVDLSSLPVKPINRQLQTATGEPRIWPVESRALLAYRGGHYEEAVGWCDEYLKLLSVHHPAAFFSARGLAIKAMAQHRSGAHELARKTYDVAKTTFIREQGDNPPVHALLALILLREAASVLGLTQDAGLSPEVGAFVVLSKENAEREFDTLAVAVDASSPGDTIEIRGNGPFVTGSIEIKHALAIRAGEGFRPIIRNRPQFAGDSRRFLLVAGAALVLEGLEIINGGADESPDSESQWRNILFCKGASAHIANCRFVNVEGTLNGNSVAGIDLRSYRGIVQNCEFVQPERTPLWWQTESGGYLVVENSVLAGPIGMLPPIDAAEWNLEIRRTSLSAPLVIAMHFPNIDPQFRLKIEAGQNVFDYRSHVFSLPGAEPDQASAMLAKLVTWRDEQNAYSIASVGDPLVKCGPPWDMPQSTILKCDKGLAAWKQYWSQPNAQVLVGPVRFAGGDLNAKKNDPEQLTPEDFRLLPDSAGYRAGPDGKDLGADIDLVGPGEAYERWKQTPEFQAWQNETRALMAEERRLAAALQLFDQQMEQRRWAEAAETFHTLVEQRGLTIFGARVSSFSLVHYAVILVHLGEMDRYRDYCAKLLDVHGTTENAQTAANVCKACLIVPRAVELSLLPSKLIDADLTATTGNERLWKVEAQALLAYRSGDYEDAANKAAEFVELCSSLGLEGISARGLAIMAMAQHRSGAHEHARKTHEKARRMIQRLSDIPPSTTNLLTDILMSEADDVLGRPEDKEALPAAKESEDTEPESNDVRQSAEPGSQPPAAVKPSRADR